MTVTPAPLTITAVTYTKPYDTTKSTPATPTLPTVTGLQGSDTVTGLTEAYDSKNAGTSKTLSVTSYTVNDGNSGHNYTVTTLTNNTGVIQQKALTIAATGIDKVYNGATTATVTLSDNRLSGDVFSDNYNAATFADANVGTLKTINVSGISISGTDAGNYTVNTSAVATATITKAPTATSVFSSSSPSVFPLAITFSATVANTGTNVPPAGTLTFMDGSTTLASAVLASATATSSTASFTTSGAAAAALANGSHSITATYTPASPINFVGSMAPLLTQIVTNVTPVASITGPTTGIIAAAGTPVSFTGSFTDTAGDTHTAKWTFSYADSSGTRVSLVPITGVVTESAGGGGTVSASYAFSSAGVYDVKLDVTDFTGATGTATTYNGMPEFAVIYDPSAGFVTGGGWINSPAGAMPSSSFCSNCTGLTGKASFGFNAKYQKGQSVPDGQTQFQFQVGNLDFHSTSYSWLLVSGPMAQYKGAGAINGSANYTFLLTARDGSLAGGNTPDGFRMKIMDSTGTNVIYDNMITTATDDMTSNNTQALAGGSVVLHSK
jgi:YDG domain/Bacterial Ig-like domain (group 3)